MTTLKETTLLALITTYIAHEVKLKNKLGKEEKVIKALRNGEIWSAVHAEVKSLVAKAINLEPLK